MDPVSERAHLQNLLNNAIDAVEAFRAADEARFRAMSSAWQRMTHIRDRRELRFLTRSASATTALKALADAKRAF